MNELTASFIQDVGEWSQVFWAWFIGVVPILKSIGIALSAFFVWGIMYSVYQSGAHYLFSDRLFDAIGIKDLPQRRARRSWKTIVGCAQNRQDSAAWVQAITNADALLNEWLRIAGYKGTNIDERIIGIPAGAMASLESITAAHAISAQTSSKKFKLTHDLMVDTLRKYKRALVELKAIE